MKVVCVCILVSTLCAVMATMPANGAQASSVEKVVYAPVLRVVATAPSTTTPQFCDTGIKPEAGAGLAAQLRWDFGIVCPTSPATSSGRYEVTYTWDGRTYTQTMDRHPGPRVALQIRVR